ncbi:MAG: hypothetical protein U0271_09705 [Polyangiaceae bacterium]
MGDVTVDIPTRYSIFVPKPLSRLNLGGWQKREGASQSPKFGYDGVSIQSEKSLFLDVWKGTYLQAQGGFVGHASEWLQVSTKAMTLATLDNATMGADGIVTLAAGAGQGPTWTLDHGDSMETVPYLNLGLHYRVEEIQNGLFEFFRGRRKKDDPAMEMVYPPGQDWVRPTAATAFMKAEVTFDSSDPDKGGAEYRMKKGNPIVQDSPFLTPATWEVTPKPLRGGFELMAEQSWQLLHGKPDWSFREETDNKDWRDGDDPASKKKPKKVAPYDLFSGMKDVRYDPASPAKSAHGVTHALEVQNDVDANRGAATSDVLKWGFSSYFSRFDPYLLVDPDVVRYDPKLGPTEKQICVFLAHANNLATNLKRRIDVLYKLTSVVKDNAFMKLVTNAAQAVDGLYQPVKALRSNVEAWAGMFRGDRGAFHEQMADEGIFGMGKRGLLWQKLGANSAAKSTAKAAVRSIAPYKDPTPSAVNPNGPDADDAKKGFYGGDQQFGGGYKLRNGHQLADGDQITISSKKKDGTVVTFDTPPLRLSATAAVIKGSAVTSSSWIYDAGTYLEVAYDGGAYTKVDLTNVPGAKPAAILGSPILQSAFTVPATANTLVIPGTLAGTSLTVAVDGVETTIAFDETNSVSTATVRAALADALPELEVLVVAGVTLKHKKYGPGARIEIKDSTARTALGLPLTAVSGAGIDAVMAYVQGHLPNTTLASSALKFQSTTTGTTSKVALRQTPQGVLAELGISATSATGTAPKLARDVTAEDLVALFSQAPEAAGVVKFTAEDGQVVITSEFAGDTSFVRVTRKTGEMCQALQFLGDQRGEADYDEVRELPEIARGLDDFDKANTELQKMPDDAGNLVRPIIVLAKNAMNIVSKAYGVAKSLAKVAGIKLPSSKGSIGLIANKGISLGTPDRIVGVGGQGIVFVADGGTGAPDKAKYVLLEDTFNRIIGGDIFGKYEKPKPPKETTGFKVFSDSTTDLVARNTAHVLALGRFEDGNRTKGSGIARVAGSFAVELAGQERVVLGVRDENLGRVEVLGRTVAIGMTDVDVTHDKFGLADRGTVKGWPTDLRAAHAQTSSLLMHSTSQACMVVGDYMIHVRSKAEDLAPFNRMIDERLAAAKTAVNSLKARRSVMTLAGVDLKEINAQIAEAEVVERRAQKDKDEGPQLADEGIIISMRDAARSTSAHNWAAENKPSIVVSKKGITITTTTNKDAEDATARITLDKDGISIVVGANGAGAKISKDKVELRSAKKRAVLDDNQLTYDGSKIDFSSAQKITLG